MKRKRFLISFVLSLLNGLNAESNPPKSDSFGRVTPECDEMYGWKSFGQNCYKIFGSGMYDKKAWYIASETCIINGGNLTSIHSQAEDEFVASMFEGVYHEGGGWMGLYRDDHNNFKWVDGSTYDYNNWDEAHDEPDGQGCANYEGRYDYKWWETPCDHIHSFCCKKPAY